MSEGTAWDYKESQERGMCPTAVQEWHEDCQEILELLAESDRRQQTIRRDLFMSKGQARRRLRTLKDEGKIDTYRDGRQVYYTLADGVEVDDG